MSGVLCIDFGTSSVRAVRRMPGGKIKVLDIGRVAKSRLDDASIRSDIHIDGKGLHVSYGERAVVARRKAATLLYEASPKLWLKSPGDLQRPAADGTKLMREDLLAGLMANVLRACIGSGELSQATMDKLDVLIAHPVWPSETADQANAALCRISTKAQYMAFERDWATAPASTLAHYSHFEYEPSTPDQDVIEPVAAAVELLPSDENGRRICAVVDIGAGTTDIGLFRAVAPDWASSVRSKLYPLGEPRSVFKAGNVVDEIVFDMLRARANRANESDLEDVRARIRQVKETLFQDGFVQELGVDLQLEDIQAHPDAKAMAREIRRVLESAVQDSSSTIFELMNARTHGICKMQIVLAGGGASIEFLRKAIGKPFEIHGRSLQVDLSLADEGVGRDVNLFGAGRGRMAVALGGASFEYDSLIHEHPRSERFARGSL
jgi:hypothetical protein